MKIVLSHSSRLIVVTAPEIREQESRAAKQSLLEDPVAMPRTNLSFIRTLTVGFGFTPNLLTPEPRGGEANVATRALAGSHATCIPPVGTSTPP
jgi:hypothetical protein